MSSETLERTIRDIRVQMTTCVKLHLSLINAQLAVNEGMAVSMLLCCLMRLAATALCDHWRVAN